MRWWRRSPTPLPDQPDCDEVAAVLQAYLDGELGPQDADKVHEHLRHCDRCEIAASTVTRVIDAIRRQRPDLDPEPVERLTGFLDQLSDEGPPPDR